MKLVALAQVLRAHGIPKDHSQQYKIKIFNPTSGLWPDVKTLYRIDNNSKLELLEAPRPLVKSWGQATEALIRVSDSLTLGQGVELGIERESFPKIEGDADFYLCDVWSFQVIDEKGQSYGQIKNFFEVAPGVLNFVVENSTGEQIEFPANWISKVNHEDQKIIVPEIYEWKLN
ncbi:MAG: hypothetical protein KA116_07420 [Proteobacteria bacterium]|nr:hypothetical protein [Pseudomonadota bacterium]